jgi:hypothetical protein
MKRLMIGLTAALSLASAGHSFGAKKSEEAVPERLGAPAMNETPKSPTVPGEYLISFEATVSDSKRSDLFKKWGVKELEKVGSTPLYLIAVPEKSDSEKILRELRATPGVRYVEANLKMHTFGP